MGIWIDAYEYLPKNLPEGVSREAAFLEEAGNLKIRATKRLKEVIVGFAKKALEEAERAPDHWPAAKLRGASLYAALLYMRDLYEKTFLELDTFAKVYYHQGRIMVVPYLRGGKVPGRGDVWDFLDSDQNYRDWSYQDKADPDDRVPETEWEERGRFWKSLLYDKGGASDRFLLIEVCRPEIYYTIDPSFDEELKELKAGKIVSAQQMTAPSGLEAHVTWTYKTGDGEEK